MTRVRKCGQERGNNPSHVHSDMDPNSFANLNEVVVTDYALNLQVDFERKVLKGSVTLQLNAITGQYTRLCCDTRDLTVVSVVDAKGNALTWKMGETHEAFGTALEITLLSAESVTISYETSPTSTAIQWLAPSQTSGGSHPYLFTQCQAIHARSMLPCQDSPSVKATYSASVTVPAGLTALMSALSTVNAPNAANAATQGESTTTFTFNQPVRMPSYLMALAVGNLTSARLSERCAVWCEPELLEACAYEFAETEKYLKAAEDLLGPYVWGRYDLLCLPGSFPYGGMENPCLTFVTPTLLAGDRSLANVVAHEIAHSWTGNLVGPTNWEHFWLNEGFTVFCERKILERAGHVDVPLHWEVGYKHLEADVERYSENSPFTALVQHLEGIDPDDAFSSVPYERGSLLLRTIEGILGVEAMEQWLRTWIDGHKGQAVTTAMFVDHIKAATGDALTSFPFDAWFSQPGMPTSLMRPLDSTQSQELQAAARSFCTQAAGGEADIPQSLLAAWSEWSSLQRTFFLDCLLDGVKAAASSSSSFSPSLLEAMAQQLGLATSQNMEICYRWGEIGIACEWSGIFPTVRRVLTTQGRMKFTRPLYRSLYHSTMGKTLAVELFREHENFYHSICHKMVAKDLELA